jgi:hypothetical protein
VRIGSEQAKDPATGAAPAVGGTLLRLRTALLGVVVLLDQALDLVAGATGGGVGEQEKMVTGHFSCPFMKSTAIAPFDDLKVPMS